MKDLSWVAAALIYLGYFGMIAFAIYWTNSLWPLIALLFSPSVEMKK